MNFAGYLIAVIYIEFAYANAKKLSIYCAVCTNKAQKIPLNFSQFCVKKRLTSDKKSDIIIRARNKDVRSDGIVIPV